MCREKVGLRGWPTNTRGPLTVDLLAWATQPFVWYQGVSPCHCYSFLCLVTPQLGKDEILNLGRVKNVAMANTNNLFYFLPFLVYFNICAIFYFIYEFSLAGHKKKIMESELVAMGGHFVDKLGESDDT